MRYTSHYHNRLTFEIDSSSYSIEILNKCLYWYSGQYNVSIIEPANSGLIEVELECKDKQENIAVEKLVERLKQDLIDFKLRDIVEKETRIIRELLIAKAFSHYESQDPDSHVSDPVGFNPQNIADAE